MTFSINLSNLSLSNLSNLDKVAIIFALAKKYCPENQLGFLNKAKTAKLAGGYKTCKNICVVDILPHVNVSIEDQKILDACI